MTGYTVHTGSSEKFASGWDRIFSDESDKDKQPARKKTRSAAGKGKRKQKKTS